MTLFESICELKKHTNKDEYELYEQLKDINESNIESVDFEELLNNIWVYKFRHCGCGDMWICYKTIFNVLKYYISIKEVKFDNDWFEQINKLSEKHLGVDSVYENPLLLYLIYDLDRIGILDHGSSIGGSWITDLGKSIYTILEFYLKRLE